MEVVIFYWQESHVGSPPNEWVDGKADYKGFADADGVDIMRYTPRHYSMRLAAPARGVLRWAKEKASRHVAAELRKAVVNTQLRDVHDLHIENLPIKYELLAREVRSRRRCAGDERYCETVAMREMVEMMGCPFGCSVMTDQGLRPAPFTWSHVQFFCCGATEVVEARGEWLGGSVAAEALGGGGVISKGLQSLKWQLECSKATGTQQGSIHTQLTAMVRLAAEGVEGVEIGDGTRVVELKRADFSGEERRGSEYEDCVRGVGALFRPSGDARKNRNDKVLKLATSVAIAGLRVQQVADELTVAWMSSLRDVANGWRIQCEMLAEWRSKVVETGPWAVAELRRLSAAAGELRRRANAEVAKGTMTAPQRRWVGERIGKAKACRAAAIVGSRGRASLGGEVVRPAVWWLLAARVGEYVGRRRAQAAGSVWEDDFGFDRMEDAAFDTMALEADGRGRLTGGWRNGVLGRAEARGSAMRAYVTAGGRQAVDTERGRLTRLRAARANAKQAAGFRRCMTGVGSMSGRPLEPVGEKIRWERARGRSTAARAAVVRSRKERKRRVTQELRRGLESDDSDRWAVDELVEVVRRAGRGGGIKVRVRWAGEDADGAPWEDSWIGLRELTPDLRTEARAMLGPAGGRAGRAPAGVQKAGWRRSPRLAEIDASRVEEEADVEGGAEEEGVEEGGAEDDEEMSEGAERESMGSKESEESSGGEQGEEDAVAVGSKRGRTARGQGAEGLRSEASEVDPARRAQEPSNEDWLAAAPQMVEGLVPCMGCAVALRLSEGGVTGLACDGGCGRKLRAADRRLSCGECDLDVCVGCAGKQAGAGERPEELKRLLGSNAAAWAGYVWVGGWWVRGLVAAKALKRDDIIAEYTGPLIGTAEADAMGPEENHFLMDAQHLEAGGGRVVIDGTPTCSNINLAGFANFATAWAANAYFRDAGGNGEAPNGRETYVVLCAKGDIDAGVEIRVDYNFGSQGVGTFHHYLTANCGVPKHELASRIFREAVWRRPR